MRWYTEWVDRYGITHRGKLEVSTREEAERAVNEFNEFLLACGDDDSARLVESENDLPEGPIGF